MILQRFKKQFDGSKVLRAPWRYFFMIHMVCFLLGLCGVIAAICSGRHIHPEWSLAMIGSFGVVLSFAYASFLSFVCVGCSLFIACNQSVGLSWILRFAGFVPIVLSYAMFWAVHDGSGVRVAKLMALIPLLELAGVVTLLGLVWVSCLGWKCHTSMKRGERCAPACGDNHPD